MSYPQSTLATFENMLGTLDHLLGKAEAAGVPDILDARLAPDMFPLAAQVRVVAYQIANTLNRLAGTDLTLEEDDPADFAEANAMVGGMREAINGAPADAFVAADTPVKFDVPNGMVFALTAEEYVRDWTIPQVHFHVTTFYAILRAQGVELGKADFVGYMMQHIKQ